MNTDLVLMFGALILLAISGLLVFCFTESKGKNTPHARKRSGSKAPMQNPRAVEHAEPRNILTH